jgi:hypothetical protein
MIKTIISFSYEGHSVPAIEVSEPPGRAIAELLISQLKRMGAEFKENAPISGEGGWTWKYKMGRSHYKVFLNSAGIGSPIKDYWVVSFFNVSKWIFELFSRHKTNEISAHLSEIADYLNSDKKFKDIQWWDENSFVKEILKPGSIKRKKETRPE